MSKRKIIFVDRDGTLIVEPEDFQIDSLDKFKLVKGVIPSLLRLKNRGYRFVIVSNQDGLGSTNFPQADFDLVHNQMIEVFESQGITFDDTLICPHMPKSNCMCRKPNVGMLIDYLKDPTIDWDNSIVIGDRPSDINFADNIGLRAFQIGCGKNNHDWSSIADELIALPRRATIERSTKETSVKVQVNIDGKGAYNIDSGIAFFDHMLEQLTYYSKADITLKVEPGTQIDGHHIIEDAAITLGSAMNKALGDRFGIARFGFCLPMDDCNAQVALDLSNRPYSMLDIPIKCEQLGTMQTEMISHFFSSWATSMGANLHIKVTPGNSHHMAEAAFKALGKSLYYAFKTNSNSVSSTKGSL